jgi:hypothetical protein
MRDLLYLGFVAVFAALSWVLLVLFTRLTEGRKGKK